MSGFDLSGRTVLVTGASSGLGRHLAMAVSRAGARVAACARRTDRLQTLVGEIGRDRAAAIAMDVEDESSVVAGFDAAERALGPVDGVIANAGMNLPGMALDLPAADFDRIMAVNLRGVFLTAREAARRMIGFCSKDNARGRIVLVASMGAHTVLPGVAAYCASKGGVVTLGKALAREWANKGINVNCICPGFIATDLNDGFLASESGRRMIQGFPRRRLMRMDDLDGIVIHLLSDSSQGITGAAFNIDDGQSL